MELSPKSWFVGAVLLVLLSFVAFNFTQITGKITKQPSVTEVTVDPDTFMAGSYINANIIPSKACARRLIHIFDSSGIRKATVETRKSHSRFCDPITVRWKTPSTFQGTYTVAVYDYGLKEYVRTNFTVVYNDPSVSELNTILISN